MAYKGKVYIDKATEISLSRQLKDSKGTWEPWITNITGVKSSNKEAKVLFGDKKTVKVRFMRGGPKEFVADYNKAKMFIALAENEARAKKPAAPPAASSPKSPDLTLSEQICGPQKASDIITQPNILRRRRRLAPKTSFGRLVREIETASRN